MLPATALRKNPVSLTYHTGEVVTEDVSRQYVKTILILPFCFSEPLVLKCKRIQAASVEYPVEYKTDLRETVCDFVFVNRELLGIQRNTGC